jgi:hypothetical protein
MKLKHLLVEAQDKGLYVTVKFSEDTIERILTYCKKNKIPGTLKKEEFHSTLVQSKTDVPGFTPHNKLDEIGIPLRVEPWDKKTREADLITESNNTMLVLRFKCDYLEDRFDELIAMGASRKFKTFKPHITLSYDVGPNFNSEKLSPADEIGELHINFELADELKVD